MSDRMYNVRIYQGELDGLEVWLNDEAARGWVLHTVLPSRDATLRTTGQTIYYIPCIFVENLPPA